MRVGVEDEIADLRAQSCMQGFICAPMWCISVDIFMVSDEILVISCVKSKSVIWSRWHCLL